VSRCEYDRPVTGVQYRTEEPCNLTYSASVRFRPILPPMGPTALQRLLSYLDDALDNTTYQALVVLMAREARIAGHHAQAAELEAEMASKCQPAINCLD